jgi:hypothetical protein
MKDDNKFIFYLSILLILILIFDFTSSFIITMPILIIINQIGYIVSLLYCIYMVLMDFMNNKKFVLSIIVLYIDVIAFIVFFWFLPYFNFCSNPPCYFR